MPALSPRRPADASCAPRRLFFALTLPPALHRQLVDWRAFPLKPAGLSRRLICI